MTAAARHGIYSVIDMHQDAWGKYVASPPGTVCPNGTKPDIGWDGAPTGRPSPTAPAPARRRRAGADRP